MRSRGWEYSTKRALKHQLDIIEIMGGCCNRCGEEFYPAAYELHHVQPYTKDPKLGKLLTCSWETIESALTGCVLL